MRYLTLTLLLLTACSPDLWTAPPLGVRIEDERIREAANRAIEWWNWQVGEEVYYILDHDPDVTITIAETGYHGGQANIKYSKLNGFILDCEVEISEDIIENMPLTIEVTKHEFGHCLALDDALYSDNNIMSSPVPSNGQVVDRDLNFIWGMLD